ncbi:MAG: metalloregulator ArsR/SmtB family transcription factor [Planctomycetota bacterium]
MNTIPDDNWNDDAVWKALADPHRRRLLDLLRESPRTTGWLAERFETSRFAIMKHLKVLEAADLIIVERRGRERFNHLNPAPIQAIQRRWLRPFEATAADRLLRLKELSEAKKEEDSER